jgi:hypothetical protein
MTHHTRDRDVRALRFDTFEGGRLKFVSGAFDEVKDAERAVQALERRGFGRAQITVLMPEDIRTRYAAESPTLEVEKGTKAAEGLGAGSAIGGAAGAFVGALAAAGTSLIIPGLGLIVAGPIAGALAGAGAGGVTGGLLGALVGAGMPEYRAKYYEEKLQEGGIVVGVEARSEDEADAIEDELKDCGADDVQQVETPSREL